VWLNLAIPTAKPRISDRIAKFFGYEKPKSRAAGPRAFNGGYQGARVDRTTQEWNPGNLTPDVLHRQDGRMLRERARDLVENNPMAKAAVKAYIANVIRCGIMPKPMIEQVELRKTWRQAWDLWIKRDADITRVQHFYELQKLWLEEVIVGGGCLVHFVQLPPAKARRRRLPLAVELIPEERFCEDGDFLGKPPQTNGNRIVRGVEIDSETGEHVAYWVKSALPNDLYPTAIEKNIRLPAEQCVYGYNRTRIGQHRGFTMLAPVIMYLWKLGYYTDNELMASAIRSCYAVLIKTADGGPLGGLSDETGATVTDMNGNPIDRLEPGIIGNVQHADEITGVGPNTPPGDAATWIKLIQRSIAVGMDLSYFGMMRDTSDSNFAGFRAGLNEDRSRYEMLQDFCAYKLVDPTYERFVPASVLAGTEGFPSPSQYTADPDSFLVSECQYPGWPSVTPLDDARASEIELAIGVNTRGRIIGSRGYDRVETFEELAVEKNDAERLGINIAAEPDAALADDQITSEDRK